MQLEDLDSPALVDALTQLVLGAQSAADTAQPSAPAGDALTSRSAASVAVRLRALTYLQRSVGAANRFPGTLQATFHCIFGPDASPKLQVAGSPNLTHH